MTGSTTATASRPDVSVVIVNTNAVHMLERTLRTLYESGQRSTLEVIVVDNASTDDSVAMVRERFPSVRCLVNAQNIGYARANNQGMAAATGRYLFLLNNDTIIYPDTIDALVRYLDAHPEVGAAGSKVLNIDGTVQGTIKEWPTPMAALFGRHSWFTRAFPRNPFSRRYLVYLDQDFSRPFPVGSVSSCAMLVRREAIARAGLIDEKFFVYWCDVDWCRAIWAAGFEVHCVPDSVLVHDEHKGGTRPRGKRSAAAIIDFHRGAYVYYRKWHVPHPLHPAHAFAIAGLTVRAVLVCALEHLRWSRRARGAA